MHPSGGNAVATFSGEFSSRNAVRAIPCHVQLADSLAHTKRRLSICGMLGLSTFNIHANVHSTGRSPPEAGPRPRQGYRVLSIGVFFFTKMDTPGIDLTIIIVL